MHQFRVLYIEAVYLEFSQDCSLGYGFVLDLDQWTQCVFHFLPI